MHLIKEPDAKAKKPPRFLERLLGKTSGFDKDENKTVIAHELTHALADQNFDLDALQDAVKDDDDRDLALSALIEGEATLTMIGAQMNDWDGRPKIAAVTVDRLDRILSLISTFMPMAGGRSLREAPVILSESLIFPYLRGLVFCARLTNDGGWKAIDDAYREPPLSTEQILHPEKYRARARPAHGGRPRRARAPPDELDREPGRNVVGEMQLGVLLRTTRRQGGRRRLGRRPLRRVRRPRRSPRSRLALDLGHRDDAREFAQLRPGSRPPSSGPTSPDRTPSPTRSAAPTRERSSPSSVRGLDVAVVEGFASDATESLIEAAFQAKKTEMTHAAAVAAGKNGAKTDD